MKKLEGKVALVTGGSRGIGAATARALAENGADVAISYSGSREKAVGIVHDREDKDVHATAFKADQANAAQVNGLVKTVFERFGRLHVLVNNAGVAVTGLLGDPSKSIAQYDRQFAINAAGVAATVRAAAGIMSKGGRTISVGSTAGTRVPSPPAKTLKEQKRGAKRNG